MRGKKWRELHFPSSDLRILLTPALKYLPRDARFSLFQVLALRFSSFQFPASNSQNHLGRFFLTYTTT